jgi:subtilisin-like proprotein convertase family protein
MTGEGDLLVAGYYYDASVHAHMILMKIEAATGDSLWTQEYGDYYSSSIGDAIRTDDFGYLTVGRANYSGTQNRQVHVMKLDHGNETAHLAFPRENLFIPIDPALPATDVIDFTADVDTIHGVSVVIDSLVHPSVGDLEVTLTHNGATVTLVDRPVHSGENFIQTGFMDAAYRHLDWDYAPYTGWYLPEDPLAVFMAPPAEGDWTLTVLDHGSGGKKATTGYLAGWSLNFLVDAGSGTGIPTPEAWMNFGLEPIRPNPVGQEAFVGFRIPEPGHVKVTVYNQVGQLVEVLANEELPEGLHERTWSPGPLAPGTYFVHLESGGMVSVRKALLNR